MKKFSKKLTILFITVLITISLIGCGEVIKDFVSTDLNASMMQRIESNIEMAGKLKASNFISEATYNSLVQTLEKQKSSYISLSEDMMKVDDKGNLVGNKSLLRGIKSFSPINGKEILAAGVTTIKDDDGKSITVTDGEEFYAGNSTMKNLCLIDWLVFSEERWNKKDANGDDYVSDKTYVIADKNVEPFVLIDSSVADEVNEKFGYQVYVLAPDIQTKDGTGSIDGIMALLQSCVEFKEGGGSTITNVGTLNNYFVPVVDENGNAITLVDMTDENNQIIRVSKPQDLSDYKNEPGYDLVVSQWNVPFMTLRFQEFSEENINKLSKLMGLNDNKYVFYSQNDINAVYLMEYPVSVLTSIEEDSSDETIVKGAIETSGIGINLLTGKIIKYDHTMDSSGNIEWLASGKVISETSDLYLTVGGADNNDADGLSSFILKGMTSTVISYSTADGDGKKSINCGRIILRDYLEATYAPAYDSDGDEDVSVFGRKIRLVFNDWEESNYKNTTSTKQYTPTWKKGTDMAYFIDKDGKKVVNSPMLQITDFCDAKQLMANYTQVQRLNRIGEEESVTLARNTDKDIQDISDLQLDNRLKRISPTIMFPSPTLGQTDWKNDTAAKQRFYCLTTTKGLFDSALFSSWIESKSTTASLDWWNKYLSDNDFLYNVGHVSVNSYLLGNYEYELSQNGIVILDLETVATIQEMYDEEGADSRVSKLRTLFMIIGWALIVFSLVLRLLWVIDTNTDAGLGLVEKVTMGNWVAVKYDDDIPSNHGKVTYLTSGKMFIRCLVLVAVGILLINVNIFDIVTFLVHLFGGIATKFDQFLKGLQ